MMNIDRYVDGQCRAGIKPGDKVRVKATRAVGEVTGVTEVFGVNVVFHDEGREIAFKFYELEAI